MPSEGGSDDFGRQDKSLVEFGQGMFREVSDHPLSEGQGHKEG